MGGKSADRGPEDCLQAIDAEVVEEACRDSGLIGDGDVRKDGSIRLARIGIEGAGPG